MHQLNAARKMIANQVNIPAAIIKEAAAWLSRMQEKPLTETEHAKFKQWLLQSHEHAQAWQRAELLSNKLNSVPVDFAMKVLDRPQHPERRAFLRSATALGTVVTTSVVAYKALPWQGWVAEHQTAMGENKTILLADGGKLVLNANSAVDVFYSNSERLIRLYRGEIYIATAHDVLNRPLLVETDHGRLHALGTQFVVRKQDENTYIGVVQGAVDVLPKDHATEHLVIKAGHETLFNAATLFTQVQLNDNASTWLDGIIYADNMPLPEFIGILSRYRTGVLKCDASVAEVRVSGAFQLKNPEEVLDTIQKTRPIKIEWRTRYWASIVKAS